MKLTWMTSAALAMGVSSVIPSLALADHGRDRREAPRYERVERYERHDRDDRRYEREERFRDFDRNISLRDVPRNVLETVDCERHGRAIEEVQYVLRDGKFFYRFRIDDPGRRDRDMNIRVGANGRLLSIEEAAQCDPGYAYRR